MTGRTVGCGGLTVWFVVVVAWRESSLLLSAARCKVKCKTLFSSKLAFAGSAGRRSPKVRSLVCLRGCPVERIYGKLVMIVGHGFFRVDGRCLLDSDDGRRRTQRHVGIRT